MNGRIVSSSSLFFKRQGPISIKLKFYCASFQQLFQLPPWFSRCIKGRPHKNIKTNVETTRRGKVRKSYDLCQRRSWQRLPCYGGPDYLWLWSQSVLLQLYSFCRITSLLIPFLSPSFFLLHESTSNCPGFSAGWAPLYFFIGCTSSWNQKTGKNYHSHHLRNYLAKLMSGCLYDQHQHHVDFGYCW